MPDQPCDHDMTRLVNKYCRADCAAKPTTYYPHVFLARNAARVSKLSFLVKHLILYKYFHNTTAFYRQHVCTSVNLYRVLCCPNLTRMLQNVSLHSHTCVFKIPTFSYLTCLPCNIEVIVDTFHNSQPQMWLTRMNYDFVILGQTPSFLALVRKWPFPIHAFEPFTDEDVTRVPNVFKRMHGGAEPIKVAQ